MRWAVALVVAGCGFRHGELSDDASLQPPNEAAIVVDVPVVDTSPGVTCYDKWLSNTIRFNPPTAIAQINSTGFDRDPFVMADELTIYFSSARAGTAGGGDVWVAKRSTPAGTFGTPVAAAEFNSTSDETKLSISANNLVAVVGSTRPGGAGGVDVWEAIRTSTSQNWPAMNRMNVMAVETAGSDHDPTISSDAQTLYIAPDNPNFQHLVVSTRSGNGTFTATSPMIALNSGTGDADPSPTPDQRILAFASNRPAVSTGNGDVYYATRTSTAAAFGAPLIVPDINTTSPEGDPHISADGCRIYFARRVDAGDNWDIFVASAQP